MKRYIIVHLHKRLYTAVHNFWVSPADTYCGLVVSFVESRSEFKRIAPAVPTVSSFLLQLPLQTIGVTIFENQKTLYEAHDFCISQTLACLWNTVCLSVWDEKTRVRIYTLFGILTRQTFTFSARTNKLTHAEICLPASIPAGLFEVGLIKPQLFSQWQWPQ